MVINRRIEKKVRRPLGASSGVAARRAQRAQRQEEERAELARRDRERAAKETSPKPQKETSPEPQAVKITPKRPEVSAEQTKTRTVKVPVAKKVTGTRTRTVTRPDVDRFRKDLEEAGVAPDVIKRELTLLHAIGVQSYNVVSRQRTFPVQAGATAEVVAAPRVRTTTTKTTGPVATAGAPDLDAFRTVLEALQASPAQIVEEVALLNKLGVKEYNARDRTIDRTFFVGTGELAPRPGVEQVGPQKDWVDIPAFENSLKVAGLSEKDVETRVKLLKSGGVEAYNKAFLQLLPVAAISATTDQEQALSKLGVPRVDGGYDLGAYLASGKGKKESDLLPFFAAADVSRAVQVAKWQVPELEPPAPLDTKSVALPDPGDFKVQLIDDPELSRSKATIDPATGYVYITDAQGKNVSPDIIGAAKLLYPSLKEMAIDLIPFMWLRHKDEMSAPEQSFNLVLDALSLLLPLKVALTAGKGVIIGGTALRGTNLVKVVNTMERVAVGQAAETYLLGDVLAGQTRLIRPAQRKLADLIARRNAGQTAAEQGFITAQGRSRLAALDREIRGLRQAINNIPNSKIVLANEPGFIGGINARSLDAVVVALRESNPAWRTIATIDTRLRRLRGELDSLARARGALQKYAPAYSDISKGVKESMETALDARIQGKLSEINVAYRDLGSGLGDVTEIIGRQQGTQIKRIADQLNNRETRQQLVAGDLGAADLAADSRKLQDALDSIKGGTAKSLQDLRQTVDPKWLTPIEGGAVAGIPRSTSILDFLKAGENLDRVSLSGAQTAQVLGDLQLLGTAEALRLADQLRARSFFRATELMETKRALEEVDVPTKEVDRALELYTKAATKYVARASSLPSPQTEPTPVVAPTPREGTKTEQRPVRLPSATALLVGTTPKVVAAPRVRTTTTKTTVPVTTTVTQERVVSSPAVKVQPEPTAEREPALEPGPGPTAVPKPTPAAEPTPAPSMPKASSTKSVAVGAPVPKPPVFKLPDGTTLEPGVYPRVIRLTSGISQQTIDLDTGIRTYGRTPPGLETSPLRPSFRVLRTGRTAPPMRTFGMGVVELVVTGQGVSVKKAKRRQQQFKNPLRARLGKR